jgi:cell division protease FtsH
VTLPLHPGPPAVPVHEPDARPREPLTRYRLLFWDRAKVTVILAVFFGLSVAIRHDDVPIMSWGDAFRDQVSARSWVLWLAGVELARQAHFLLAERSGRYNQLWERRVWGAWEARMSRLDPWLRYRLNRLAKFLAFGLVALVAFSAIWGVSLLEALVQSPGRLWSNPFGGAGMPWFFQFFFAFFYIMFQFVGMFWLLSKGGIDVYMPRDIKTRFEDVWGQDKVLAKVRENIVFLERPREIEDKGGHVPSGILLYGPPGTGKTLMAEAVAGETGKPFVFVDPGAFVNMFMGVGILKVKSLFRKLRKLALRHGGVIVFFDEADSLGSRGGLSGGTVRRDEAALHAAYARTLSCNLLRYVSEPTAAALYRPGFESFAAAHPLGGDAQAGARGRIEAIMVGGGMGGGGGTLQALLTELSGLKKPRGIVTRKLRAFLNMKPKQPPKYRILVMMATNMANALDEALLRPGRIDRKYKVDYPSLEGRVRTFEGYFAKVRHVLTPEQVERLAVMSPQASGAVIKDIVNEALVVAIRDGRDVVSWQDVLEAKTFKVHGLSDGVAPVELEQLQTALHEAGHAVAAYLLRRRSVIDIATIEQRGDVGGFVSWVPTEEWKFSWRSGIENDIVVTLASLAAERLFFEGDNSSGVGGDMASATERTRQMLGRAAMGGTLTSHASHLFGDLSEHHRQAFDDQVEDKLQELYRRAQDLVGENWLFLAAVAHALASHHTISGEDIDAISEGVQGPTLDGAVYHEAAFRDAILAFLDQARDAHRAQANLSMTLPAFPGRGGKGIEDVPPDPLGQVAAAATGE